MAIYRLIPIIPFSESFRPDFDKAFGFIVRADTETEARQLANDHAGLERGLIRVGHSGREGSDPWLNPAETSCEMVPERGPATVLLRSAHTDQQDVLADPNLPLA